MRYAFAPERWVRERGFVSIRHRIAGLELTGEIGEGGRLNLLFGVVTVCGAQVGECNVTNSRSIGDGEESCVECDAKEDA